MSKPKKTVARPLTRQPVVTSAKSAMPSNKLYAAIIFAFSFIIYLNSTLNNYNMDDELVTENHRLTSKGIAAIPEIFTSPYYEDQAGYKYEYRPIVLVSFAIEHSIFGDNPHISHFINVVMYGLLCVLLFHVLLMLFSTYNNLFALLVTLIFAAHPIHTEAVASIKNRDELLAVLFCLLALRSALQFVSVGKWIHLLLVPLYYVIGILSKSSAIPFAILIPITLICLTACRAGKLFWITLLLAIPTVLFARLYSATQQAALLAALFVAVYGLYFLKYYSEIFSQIKNWIYNYKQSVTETVKEDSPADIPLHFLFLKQKIFLLFILPLYVFVFGIGMLGVYSGQLWLYLIPFIILALTYVFSKKEIRFLLQLPIFLFSIVVMIRSHKYVEIMNIGLVGFLLAAAFEDFKLNKKLKWLWAVIYATTSVIAFKIKMILEGILLLALGTRHKKWRPVSIVLVALLVAAYCFILYKSIFSGKGLSTSAILIPLIFLLAFLYYKGWSAYLERTSLLILTVFMAISYFIVRPNQHSLSSKAVYTYYQVNEVKSVDPIPVQAARPLKYIEYPLHKTDPFTLKLGTDLVVIGKYFQKILIPYPMSYYYGYAYITPTPLFSFIPILALVIYLLLAAIALFCLRKIPEVAFGILFFLAAITIFSNLFIPIPGMIADRFLFIPSIGFSVLLIFLLGLIFKLDWRSNLTFKNLMPPMKWTLLVLLIASSLLTMARNSDWKDRVTLFRHDIKYVANSAQAQNLLGLHLFIASNSETDPQKQFAMREEATTHFKKALEIYPPFLNASYDLGRTSEAMGKLDQAYQAYANTIKIDSTFYAPLFSMAVILDNQGKVAEAIPLYEKYLQKYPNRKEVYANLSFAYFKLKEYDKSIEVNRRLLAREPNMYEPTVNIAKTYLQMGQKDSAYLYLKKTDAIRPGDKNVQLLLQQLSGQK